MSAPPDAQAPVLFAEVGSSWWPLLSGPALAGAGILLEAITGGPQHVVGLLLVGAVLALSSAVWVHARRGHAAVRLTTARLQQGQESLPVREIDGVDEVGAPLGTRVLGGGWTVPKGTTEVPLRLRGGRVVLGWARDADGLRQALARLHPAAPG